MTQDHEPRTLRRAGPGPLKRLTACILPAAFLCGCSTQQAAKTEKAPPPATVKSVPRESDLATITLTADAEDRLGIRVTPVTQQRITNTRTFGADVVLPPDRTTIMAAPMGGVLISAEIVPAAGMAVRKGQELYRLSPYLAPERDLRLQLEREVASAETRVEAAKVRADRAQQLAREKAGSEKAALQAREELDLASNDLKVARARLDRFIKMPLSGDDVLTVPSPRDGIIQKVLANAGQVVPGGAPLVEVADLTTLWIRVPVYVGQLGLIEPARGAEVLGLADPPGTRGRHARAVAAPPSADPLAATADLYFELSDGSVRGDLRPGQRVSAVLTLRGSELGLVVPWSSVLHDTTGGTWVYENVAPQVYTRRRIEVRSVVNNLAVLGHGPAAGAKIVSEGAAELFGTEFGAGK